MHRSQSSVCDHGTDKAKAAQFLQHLGRGMLSRGALRVDHAWKMLNSNHYQRTDESFFFYGNDPEFSDDLIKKFEMHRASGSRYCFVGTSSFRNVVVAFAMSSASGFQEMPDAIFIIDFRAC